MRNTTTIDSGNDSCGGMSNHSSNTAPDREDSYSDSADGMMSPNTKINNVKQKYQPNDMDLINEESIESDITSSIMSKRLLYN